MKTKLQTELAQIARSIVVETIWEKDPDAKWDIQDKKLDPLDFDAWQSEVRASAIVDGEFVTGSAYLSGTWEKFGDDPAKSNPEISGYELQMTEEALEHLCTDHELPMLVEDTAKAAMAHCRKLMQERYEVQQRKRRKK